MVTEDMIISRLIDIGVTDPVSHLVAHSLREVTREVEAQLGRSISIECEEVVIDRAVGSYLLASIASESASDGAEPGIKSIKEGDTTVEFSGDPSNSLRTFASALRGSGGALIKRYRVIVW